MQYLKETSSSGTLNSITIEHRGKEITWNVRTYRTLKVDDYIVTDINKYWERLPINIQDRIFEIYEEANEAFETIELTKRLDERLLTLVSELYQYHKFEDVMRYFLEASEVKMPTDLKDRYVNGLEPDLTYLKHDYPGLVVLTIALKPMIPIWGTYINIVQAEVGNQFKEYRASALLSNSSIVQSAGYKRLSTYITAYWEGYVKDHSSAAILAGLDKEQVPEWLLGNVLIRRISIAKLVQRFHNDQPTVIITDIYNYIESLVDSLDKSFGGRVNEKGLDKGRPGDDDNTSVIENYKIKQEVSEGIIAKHNVYLKTKALDILRKIDETCPPEYYHEIKEVYHRTYSDRFDLNTIGITLIKWTLDPVVTAKAIDEVGFDAIMEGMFITHALLRHWGYKHLKLMLFSTQTRSSFVANTVRPAITEEQLNRLGEIYPFTPNRYGKRKISKYESNVAVQAIKRLITPFYGSWWLLPPWENVNDYPELIVNNERSMVPLPPDIEKVLADFIIFTRGTNHVKLYQDERV